MADNEVKIPVAIEGSEQAVRSLEEIERSIAALKPAAEQSAESLRLQRARTKDLSIELGRAKVQLSQTRDAMQRFAQVGQIVSGLNSLSQALGGQNSVASNALSAAAAGAGFGSMLGPVGTAAGAATGLLIGLANSFSDVEREAGNASRAVASFNSLRRASEQSMDASVDLSRELARSLEIDTAIRDGATQMDILAMRTRNAAEDSARLADRRRELATQIENTSSALMRENASEGESQRAQARMAELLQERNQLDQENARILRENLSIRQSTTQEILRQRESENGGRRTGGSRSRSDEGAQNARSKGAFLDKIAEVRASEERSLQEAYNAELQRANELRAESERIANEVMDAERQRMEQLADLRAAARDEELEALFQEDERAGLAEERLRIENEIAALRSDGIDDSEQIVDFERARLSLQRNSRREENLRRREAERSAQQLGQYGEMLGGVFAEAYQQAITGQKDFGTAFAESMKGILQQLGTKYMVEGVAALFQAIGFAASYQYQAAAGKAAEGAGLVALGAGLGAVGAAIPSASASKLEPERPDREGGGQERNQDRPPILINFNSPVVTAMTKAEIGREISRATAAGERRFGA